MRSLALSPAHAADCLTSASRTTSDGTFAVASTTEGVIRVYAASCAALLHEFASIHRHIYALHYTSFSDSFVTLESDAVDQDAPESETFLCVYHDWRARKMVRGYTLPLGVLESPSSQRKADCVAVCSFTGRVVVAMGTVINIWQCSRGFFEHVMELTVDMSQQHAFRQVEHVAIHGVYLAYASQTEVRVMEIHVRHTSEGCEDSATASTASSSKSGSASPKTPLRLGALAAGGGSLSSSSSDHRSVPDDADDCISIRHKRSMDELFIEVPVTCPVYNKVALEQPDRGMFSDPEQEPVPVVWGRNDAQQEAWNVAGLVKSQDVRMNQAMSYFVRENDVTVLLQRFLPPNHSVKAIKFLPETIDNRVCVEARSYTRLLVATERHAFVYYFLSTEADSTRKQMTKKILGKGERTKSRGMHKPIKVGSRTLTEPVSCVLNGEEDEQDTAESGRVMMQYSFTSPVSSITANSSFLFVATLTGVQVWSIWSPCHYVAASRVLNTALIPQPSQPQLLCTQPIPFPAAQLAALDSYVILLPDRSREVDEFRPQPKDFFIRMGSLIAPERLPEAEFELRRTHQLEHQQILDPSVMIFQQSPPSLIFSYVRQGVLSDEGMQPHEIDLLLSLFSLYRYRADVGKRLLQQHEDDPTTRNGMGDKKELLALELETKLYESLAKECAADLAGIFTSKPHRNLSRAVLLFVASNVPSREVMLRLQQIIEDGNQEEVVKATGKYLEAFVFPSAESRPVLGLKGRGKDSTEDDEEETFTRTVLLYYGKYAPEQLARLVIDSSLVWTLDDVEFALNELINSSEGSVRTKVARLVLILRAMSFPEEDWEAYKEAASSTPSSSQLVELSSYESMCESVQDMLTNHLDELVNLCVTNSDLLVQFEESTGADADDNKQRRLLASSLSQALLDIDALVFLKIIQQIFHNAIRRQEGLASTLLFCLSLVGAAAEPSMKRIAQVMATSATAAEPMAWEPTPFDPRQVFVIRVLIFILRACPSLEILMEKEEIMEDEDDLRLVKAAVSIELLRLCVGLSTALPKDKHPEEFDEAIAVPLMDLLQDVNTANVFVNHATLPDWVQEYLTMRCLPADDGSSSQLAHVLQFLYKYALLLLQEKALIPPQSIITALELPQAGADVKPSSPWHLENDFAALLVLLTLPRVSRYHTCICTVLEFMGSQ